MSTTPNLEADLDKAVTPAAPLLTQEDYDRAYKLDAGIKKLAAELEALKERIKAEAPKGKSTQVHGKVVVKTGTREDKDIDKMTEVFPEALFPQYYTAKLDAMKVAKDEDGIHLIFKPAIKTVSISFAD